MTVKCFTVAEKEHIVFQYSNKTYKDNETLAKSWGTSTRTINRVLEEHGIATPVPRLKGEAHAVMLVLKDHGIADAKALDAQLTKVPLHAHTVQAYLNRLDKSTLMSFIYNAAWAHAQGQQSVPHGKPQHIHISNANDLFAA